MSFLTDPSHKTPPVTHHSEASAICLHHRPPLPSTPRPVIIHGQTLPATGARLASDPKLGLKADRAGTISQPMNYDDAPKNYALCVS